ncbi:MAG: rlmD [Bacillales bacterium]|jgi:23S rRNA (uracil-5-)-methyltransferase RumA|nr:rlmD [Bacillales bacterium]
MRQKTDKRINVLLGQEFLISIKKLGINGEGVGYYKHQVVFVNGALPGEEVVVQVSRIHEKYCEAKIVRIKKRSEHRVKPACPVYDECGGCQLLHLDYSAQLVEKREIVVQALLRHSHFTPVSVEINDCIGMEKPDHYRNKSQFQVGKDDEEDVISGLYNANSHELVDIEECYVQHDALNKVNRVLKEILQANEVPIYDEKRKSGIVKTVVARVSFFTGEVQVTFVTVSEKFPGKRAVIEMMNKQLPEVVSIFQNVNPEVTPLVFGEKTLHLWGKETIVEKLGTLEFDLSARTFFQLNPQQTVKLYDEVKKAAKLTGKERVVDAYCGVGTIGLWLSDEAAEVRGMDILPESIEDAVKNAKRNGKMNTHYEVGKAEDVLATWARKGWKPDVVVVDPPRTGLDHKFMDSILRSKSKRIVYVSCNPSTMAKDLHYLSCEYKPKYIQPIDMFGHTSQVETVVLLERK